MPLTISVPKELAKNINFIAKCFKIALLLLNNFVIEFLFFYLFLINAYFKLSYLNEKYTSLSMWNLHQFENSQLLFKILYIFKFIQVWDYL